MQCVVCNTEMVQGIVDWHSKCEVCGYESATLQPAINDSNVHATLDETQRENGLYSLRKNNFKKILFTLKEIGPPRSNQQELLDVGAAHGWFIELAKTEFETLGIEPDQAVALESKRKGLPIRIGFFPEVLQATELFDVIVFNDVIEHIPDVRAILKACARHLKKNGRLVLNLPSSSGVFYRASKMLARIGLLKPFLRMWQAGMPSPHVHYFNKRNLSSLLESEHFRLIYSGDLESISANGLLDRIRFSKSTSPILAYPMYWAILLMLPVLKLFQSDIILQIFVAHPNQLDSAN